MKNSEVIHRLDALEKRVARLEKNKPVKKKAPAKKKAGGKA